MRYSARHKQETHRRIVEEAARQFRERGLDAVSVADVMGAAGLTHGGFYAHFGSKEELIAEALRSLRGSGPAKLGAAAERMAPRQKLAEMVKRYLSPQHRERPGQGCVVAALGTEAGRHGPAARQALAERSRGLVERFLPCLPQDAGQPREELAIAVAASLVGGMVLARLEPDARAAERILRACRRFILDALDAAPEPRDAS
jgi:TetR/AcrR family transcriptional regulator, transcriptional repressor for nem operon